MKSYEQIVEEQQKQTGTITKKDFKMISVIGKGSYGKVLLVKYKNGEQLYAMKVLKKNEILKRNQVEHTKTERRILVSNISFIGVGVCQTPIHSEDGLCFSVGEQTLLCA